MKQAIGYFFIIVPGIIYFIKITILHLLKFIFILSFIPGSIYYYYFNRDNLNEIEKTYNLWELIKATEKLFDN